MRIRGFRRGVTFLFINVLFLISCENKDTDTSVDIETSNSIVEKHGQLSIAQGKIIDKNKNEIALRGMSLFWSQWAPDYYNEETIKWLRDDWKCTIIRASLGVESGGYLENPKLELGKIKTVIDACIKYGIYVLIDWHDHNGEDHVNDAITFFNDISMEYGNSPNIIYEIYNEPLDVSWQNVIKPYAESIIQTIRSNDPDNIIIVGTPNWSQDVDEVIGNEIADINIAYSLHFYTGTHRQSLRNKCNQAISAGLPIFVTEWGLSEASGSGAIDISETNLWADYLESNNLSWCNWSVTNKDETSAILLPSTIKLHGWNDNEISEAGRIIRDYLIRMNSVMFE